MLNFYKNQKIEISTQINKLMSDIYSILPDRVWYQLGEDIYSEASGNNFGRSVSINSLGNRVIIGGNMYDSEKGLSKIYEYNDISWIQIGQDIIGNDAGDRLGQVVCMNGLGNRVAVGAPQEGTNSPGYCHIYELSGNNFNNYEWIKIGEIIGENLDRLGTGLDMDYLGEHIIIGSYLGNSNTGESRVYKFDGTSWNQIGQTIEGDDPGDFLGRGGSINGPGNRIAIGVYRDNNNVGNNVGHCRVYEYNDSSWVLMGQYIIGEAALDESGLSVAMNGIGNRVAIGGRLNDGNGVDSGHCRIYELSGNNFSNYEWIQLGQDIDGESAGDRFGTCVAINSIGNRVAIGGHLNDGSNGVDSGHCRIYELSGNSFSNYEWVQLSQDIDGKVAGENLGRWVSINGIGNRVVIGGPENNNGTARIYEYNIPV
jgi:hypothetical protein